MFALIFALVGCTCQDSKEPAPAPEPAPAEEAAAPEEAQGTGEAPEGDPDNRGEKAAVAGDWTFSPPADWSIRNIGHTDAMYMVNFTAPDELSTRDTALEWLKTYCPEPENLMQGTMSSWRCKLDGAEFAQVTISVKPEGVAHVLLTSPNPPSENEAAKTRKAE